MKQEYFVSYKADEHNTCMMFWYIWKKWAKERKLKQETMEEIFRDWVNNKLRLVVELDEAVALLQTKACLKKEVDA